MRPISCLFIVDDDPIHQKITEILLTRMEVATEISKFSDSQDTLDFLLAHKLEQHILPDIILLDLNMPIMDGWEFLDVFKDIRHDFAKTIRIYVLTSSLNEADRDRVLAYGFVSGYLTKPLTKNMIEEIVPIKRLQV
jgi:CheY-like chemotaxis protein